MGTAVTTFQLEFSHHQSSCLIGLNMANKKCGCTRKQIAWSSFSKRLYRTSSIEAPARPRNASCIFEGPSLVILTTWKRNCNQTSSNSNPLEARTFFVLPIAEELGRLGVAALSDPVSVYVYTTESVTGC